MTVKFIFHDKIWCWEKWDGECEADNKSSPAISTLTMYPSSSTIIMLSWRRKYLTEENYLAALSLYSDILMISSCWLKTTTQEIVCFPPATDCWCSSLWPKKLIKPSIELSYWEWGDSWEYLMTIFLCLMPSSSISNNCSILFFYLLSARDARLQS